MIPTNGYTVISLSNLTKGLIISISANYERNWLR
jgi:hypothetical protein